MIVNEENTVQGSTQNGQKIISGNPRLEYFLKNCTSHAVPRVAWVNQIMNEEGSPSRTGSKTIPVNWYS